MKLRLLALFALAAGGAFAAGTVQQSISKLGGTENWVLAFRWTGDASTGSVPLTPANARSADGGSIGNLQGYLITQVETVPGGPAPTNGYSVSIADAAGVDALGGAASSCSSTAAQSFAAAASAPPVQGTFNLVISGQSVASAQGTVYVFLQKPGTVNIAKLGQAGTGSSANWLTIANSPVSDSRTYNFTPQVQSTNLSGGVQATLPLHPCPLGVNGTDTNHYYYLSGGAGTAEAVIGTGGSCISGAVSGTLVFTPANSHSGAYSISSASAGITEALNACASACTVLLPAGQLTINGPIPIPAATSTQTSYRIIGTGRRTTILNIASTFPLAAAGVFIPAFNAALTYAPPGPTLQDFGVVFIQDYTQPLANFTHWPPVMFANGISGGTVSRFYVSGAWQGFVLRGGNLTYGQWMFDDVELAAFGPGGIDIDGASDVVRIHAVHFWPFYNRNPPGGDTNSMFNPAVIGLLIGGAAGVTVSDSYFLTGTSVKLTGSSGSSVITFENTGFDVFGVIDMSRASGGITMTINNCFFFQTTAPGGSAFAAPSASIVYGPTAPELTISNSIFYHSSTTQPLVSVVAPTGSNAAFGQFQFVNNLVYDSSNSVNTATLFAMSGAAGPLNVIISGNTISYETNLAYNNPMLSVSGTIGLAFQNNVNAGYGSGTWLSIASDSARHQISGNTVNGPVGSWTVTLPASKLLGVYQDQSFTYPLATSGTISTNAGSPITVGNFGRQATFFCNATAGQVNHNLPLSSAGNLGDEYTLVKTDATANACVFVPAGADTINGAANFTTTTQFGKAHIKADGAAHWFIE